VLKEEAWITVPGVGGDVNLPTCLLCQVASNPSGIVLAVVDRDAACHERYTNLYTERTRASIAAFLSNRLEWPVRKAGKKTGSKAAAIDIEAPRHYDTAGDQMALPGEEGGEEKTEEREDKAGEEVEVGRLMNSYQGATGHGVPKEGEPEEKNEQRGEERRGGSAPKHDPDATFGQSVYGNAPRRRRRLQRRRNGHAHSPL
jgi:hypothetical protein